MTDQPQVPSPEDVEPSEVDFPEDFEGFLDNPDDPQSNTTEVVDGVGDVSQDPNWSPEQEEQS